MGANVPTIKSTTGDKVLPSQTVDYLNLISGQFNGLVAQAVQQMDSLATVVSSAIGATSMATIMALSTPTSAKANDFATAYHGKDKVYTIKYNEESSAPYERIIKICDKDGNKNQDIDTEEEANCLEKWSDKYQKDYLRMKQKVLEDLEEEGKKLKEKERMIDKTNARFNNI